MEDPTSTQYTETGDKGSWHPAMRSGKDEMENEYFLENTPHRLESDFFPDQTDQRPSQPLLDHGHQLGAPKPSQPRLVDSEDVHPKIPENNDHYKDSRRDDTKGFPEAMHAKPLEGHSPKSSESGDARDDDPGGGYIAIKATDTPGAKDLDPSHLQYETQGIKEPSDGAEDGYPRQTEPEEQHQHLRSGEANSIDPAWGLGSTHRNEDFTDLLTHTNSFPEVPPLHNTTTSPSVQPLPPSQAEEILQATEDTDNFPYQALTATKDEADAEKSTIDDVLQESIHGGEDDSFAVADDKLESSLLTPADDEARFEEGLPLVSLETDQDRLAQDPAAHDPDLISRSQEAHEDDYNKKRSADPIDQEDPDYRPPPPDRKSTSNVLDSMHFVPKSDGPQNSRQLTRPPLQDLTGGGIAVSTSTVFSDVLTRNVEALKVPSENPEAKDDNLAAMWQAALDDDELLEEDDSAVDPSGFFQDGEGFLEDEERPLEQLSPTVPQPVIDTNGQMQGFSSTTTHGTRSISGDQMQYTHTVPSPLQQQQSAYQPYIPNATSFSQQGPYAPLGEQRSLSNDQVQRPSLQGAQSFADKSKGGYTSPYDLPMDVARPKRRALLQQPSNSVNNATQPRPQPPPRTSSSIYANTEFSQGDVACQTPHSNSSNPQAPPSQTGVDPPTRSLPQTMLSKKPSQFFEELPMSVKSRPASSAGRFAPPPVQHTQPLTPLQPPHQRAPPQQPAPLEQQHSTSSGTTQAYNLLPPERVAPYGSAAQQDSHTILTPVSNSRYSPAPPAQVNLAVNRNRYASAPNANGRPPSASQTMPFQPRTSSPLAVNQAVSQSTTGGERSLDLGMANSESIPQPKPPPRSASTEQYKLAQNNNLMTVPRDAPSISQYTTRSASVEPPPSTRAAQFAPSLGQSQSLPQGAYLEPLQRSQTQSPESARSRQNASRYTSTTNQQQLPSTYSSVSLTPAQSGVSAHSVLGVKAPAREINYIRPSDGREHDPLERWKGCPVFNFGFGGSIVTTFPKQVPLFAAGQSSGIKCIPGEVKLRAEKLIPLEERIASFPGPLKSKSKKKDVLEWLSRGIQDLSQQLIPIHADHALPDPRKKHEEKILLWKVLRVIVEHDGTIEGDSVAEKAMRSILSPELNLDTPQNPLLFDTTAHLTGISRPNGPINAPNPLNPSVMEELRKTLLQGDREKAVWYAVDQRMWGHAMLISSTLPREIWKQVAQEFVRQEVRTFGNNTESLAALYATFAGNWEESIDELVPPSARAGLQMVSKVEPSGPTKNALDGLDRWRETLSLILSNRTPEDGTAVIALGRLLSGYSRTEAAHICFLFAKSPGIFRGPDDPQASVVLLGADHLKQPLDYARDLDCVLLTEIYEFALTILTSSAISTISPHLQAYKLYHAMTLAEYGYRNEAQQYCDTITNTLKATTRPSPYYHPLLFTCLDDLASRLRQAPKDGSGSWISKPSIDKVSGSVWAKFNQFVAGEDNGSGSVGAGRGNESEQGPFAKMGPETPTISRTSSASELYGSYVNGGSMNANPPPAMSNSRYAPANAYTPRSSLEQQGGPFPDQRRPSHIEHLKQFNLKRVPSHQSLPGNSPNLYQKTLHDGPASSTFPSRSDNPLPTPPIQEQYMTKSSHDDISATLHNQSSYSNSQQDTTSDSHLLASSYALPSSSYAPLKNPYSPAANTFGVSASVIDPAPNFEGQSTFFHEPPRTSDDRDSYKNSSYDPGFGYESQSPGKDAPRKKSIMDDDDDEDLVAKADALKREEKVRKDRETDEAFRKAAEADGKTAPTIVISTSSNGMKC